MSAVVPAGGGGFGVIVRRKPWVPLALVIPNDLAASLMPVRKGPGGGQGIVEGGVDAAAIEEAVVLIAGVR